jgi:cell division protein ZapA (FtsZ GTPase activity inhibitor)
LAQSLDNHLKNLNELESVIKENADNILNAINIDDLLKDPEGYLLSLGDAFINEHLKEIEKAKKEGKRYAEEILNGN